MCAAGSRPQPSPGIRGSLVLVRPSTRLCVSLDGNVDVERGLLTSGVAREQEEALAAQRGDGRATDQDNFERTVLGICKHRDNLPELAGRDLLAEPCVRL